MGDAHDTIPWPNHAPTECRSVQEGQELRTAVYTCTRYFGDCRLIHMETRLKKPQEVDNLDRNCIFNMLGRDLRLATLAVLVYACTQVLHDQHITLVMK
jgi:hypothetical protein